MAKWDIEAFRARGPGERRTADLVRTIYDRHRDPSHTVDAEDMVERMIARAEDDPHISLDLSSDEYSAMFQGLMEAVEAEG